jgi:3'-phosphoadenosine 5'-phosphosulfate sulfotransferase (PAPS reductase)/FAD synthetase
MLHRCLNAGLADDVHVLFANTGKERKETLDFVHEIETRWRVPIHWVERDPDSEHHYREVTFETASRDGEPFARLILDRNYLPNPVTRFCTTDLKIRAMKGWMLARGYEHWTNIVGLRADEPRRVSKLRNRNDSGGRWDVSMPLADAGLTVADVDAFWRAQPFDLQLKKWEGNCDLCFLKGRAKRMRIMRDWPELAECRSRSSVSLANRCASPRSQRPSVAVRSQRSNLGMNSTSSRHATTDRPRRGVIRSASIHRAITRCLRCLSSRCWRSIRQT